jgi:hypothetical protein
MRLKKSILIAVLVLGLITIGLNLWRGPETEPPEDPIRRGEEPHPSDGRGTATVHPADPIRVFQQGTWTINYVTDDTGIATGGGIVFQVSPFWEWSQPQVENPDFPGYTIVRSSNPDVRFEILGSNLHYLLIFVSEGELAGGDTVSIVYGDTGGGDHPRGAAIADRYAEKSEEFYLKIDGNGDGFFVPIEASPTVDIIAAEGVKLVVRAPSMVEAGEPFDIHVTALDPLDNWDRSFRGELRIDEVDGLSFTAKDGIVRADSGLAIVRTVAREPGKYRVRVSTEDESMDSESERILCLPKRPEYSLFWGDLHGHSGLSDGSGSPDEYYRYARWVSKMEVSALTDHDAHGIFPLDEKPALWRGIVASTNRHYDPGRFVTFCGYEWTNWTEGHRHVLFPGDDGEIYSFRDPDSDTPSELGALLTPWQAIAIPHHPAGGPKNIEWDNYEERFEPLVEICSVHGNSETPGAPLQIYRSSQGSFVTNALQRGFQFGILASGDTHDGHPGRRSVGAPSMGIAGIWATELTREAIWKALLARRTYGTSGERIVLRFQIDGHWMGEKVPLSGPTELGVDIFAAGTSSITRIDLLENEEMIRTFPIEGEDAWIRSPQAVAPKKFYRIRLIQEDGGMAWSSPIWFVNE